MKRWMIYVLGVVVIFIIGHMVFNNEDGKQREVKLIAEYQAIKHPEGAKQVYYKLNRKIIKRWINSRYIYPISNNEVQEYYDQELVDKGWQQVPAPSIPGDVLYRYAKDNLILELKLNKNNWILHMSYEDAKY